jgi:nifR3 family TIM-barrel protein
MLRIGKIEINNWPLLLAPMEDLTDPSFRYICKLYGADLLYTEFISSDGIIRNGRKSLKKLEISDQERPIGIQLYGHNIESMTEAVRIVEKAQPDLIDINFGCPVKKISRRGAGAGMMKNVPLMVRMTEEIVRSTSLPVTVKTRLGWDEASKNIMDVALKLQDAGISAIAIHGRTGTQLYRGKADWTLIGEVKKNPLIRIPVIGNGDVDSPEKAKEMFNRYGIDGIMIARAAIGRPWIFRNIKHYLLTGEKRGEPGISERVDLAKLHLAKSIEHKGETRGILEMRRHFSSYFKGLPDFKETRLKLVTSVSVEEISELLDLILKRYNGFEMTLQPNS